MKVSVFINGKGFKRIEIGALRSGRKIDFTLLLSQLLQTSLRKFKNEASETEFVYVLEDPQNVDPRDLGILEARAQFKESLDQAGFQVVKVPVDFHGERLRRVDRSDATMINRRNVSGTFFNLLRQKLSIQGENELLFLLGIDETVIKFLTNHLKFGKVVLVVSFLNRRLESALREKVFFLSIFEVIESALINKPFVKLSEVRNCRTRR